MEGQSLKIEVDRWVQGKYTSVMDPMGSIVAWSFPPATSSNSLFDMGPICPYFFRRLHLTSSCKSAALQAWESWPVKGDERSWRIIPGLVSSYLVGQWLNFKLFGITYLVGKIKFKLFFPGSIGWVRLGSPPFISHEVRPWMEGVPQPQVLGTKPITMVINHVSVRHGMILQVDSIQIIFSKRGDPRSKWSKLSSPSFFLALIKESSKKYMFFFSISSKKTSEKGSSKKKVICQSWFAWRTNSRGIEAASWVLQPERMGEPNLQQRNTENPKDWTNTTAPTTWICLKLSYTNWMHFKWFFDSGGTFSEENPVLCQMGLWFFLTQILRRVVVFAVLDVLKWSICLDAWPWKREGTSSIVHTVDGSKSC